MNAHATIPPPRKLPSSPEIKRVVKAARDAGLDVAGVDALPDGTVRVFTAAAAPGIDLFAQLEKQGKL